MKLRSALVAVSVGAAVAAVAVAPVATTASTVQKHHRTTARVRSAVITSGNVNCSGTQSTNVPYDLTVPAGKTCTIKKGVSVGHDVYVDTGSTLIDQGANIAYDVKATDGPKGIGIGGSGTVGHDIDVTGVSGAGPGTVTQGSNYICATQVTHNVTILGSSSNAGPWIIGDSDEDCSSGGNLVGFNLYAEHNNNRVDISDNMQGTPPYVGGIANNLYVLGNKVTTTSPVVESNFIGDNAYCQAGTKKDGDGTHNVVGGTNSGCP